MRTAFVLLNGILVSIPTWLIVGLIHLLLILIGLPLIAWQSRSTTVDERKFFHFRARWMWLYDNREDGIDGSRGGDTAQKWWTDRTAADSLRMRIFKWSALRNPVNNLRYVPVLSPLFRSTQIGYIGTGDEPPDGQSGWAYTWQGFYSGIYIKTTTRWFWLGWKLRPSDRFGISMLDTRLPRCDFAMQFQRVKS